MRQLDIVAHRSKRQHFKSVGHSFNAVQSLHSLLVSIANTTGAAINVRVFLVPSAGAAGTGNAFLYDVSVPANNTLQYNGIEVLNAGDTIQIQAASAGLTIIASGAEAT